MSTEAVNRPVTVDPGDLSEIQQAATAWASLLRRRAQEGKKEFGAYPIVYEDAQRYKKAADRIDQAVARSNLTAFPMAGKPKSKFPTKQELRDFEQAHSEGLHEGIPREFCPACEEQRNRT